MSKTTIADGGPAYPGPWHPDMGWSPRDNTGMSLRDWFAGQALAGLLADPRVGWIDGDETVAETDDQIASSAYGYADAMLRARSNPST